MVYRISLLPLRLFPERSTSIPFLGLPSIVGRSKNAVYESIRDKIWYKVFRARYFPGSSILDADLGSRLSFTWRSILSSKALIEQGITGALEMGEEPESGLTLGSRGYRHSDHILQLVHCHLLLRLIIMWLCPKLEGTIHNHPHAMTKLYGIDGEEYLSAFSGFLDPHHSLSSTTVSSRWLAPPDGAVKINSDAAIFKESGDFSIGVIARNSQRQSLAWSANRCHRVISSKAAEAWAARTAIQLAAQFGWTRIILEVDCATLHIKLTTLRDRSSTIWPIVHDILDLSSSFALCSFSLIRRKANVVAHSLAQHATGNEMGSNILPSHSCDLVFANLPT
ncbi:UNVERIFIED_CONTAM: hypothetical protein Slati_3469100 [Sesamum latifolium]|uniref:RNase H type-1 domain-containing protein n=1 Tax=Sesamum latifolium TaxID=2727402 RepID=A0AAW2UJ58_9LAMI